MVFCESPSLTLYDVFRINSCCSTYQYFTPFYCRILLRGKDIPHFHYAFISWYTIEIFPLWVIMNISVTFMYWFLHGQIFSSFLMNIYLGVKFLDHMGTLCFIFLKNCQAVFQWHCYILYSHYQCERLLTLQSSTTLAII